MNAKQLLAGILIAGMPLIAQAEEGYKSIFDGKTLEGWDGVEGLWRVEDGAITGETTKEKPTKGNTFLIWKDTVKDFELKFEYRFLSDSGNSGCQYRSKDYGNHVVGGYQADFEAGTRYSGILYGERTGRGIMTDRGFKNHLGDGKNKIKSEKFGDSAELQKKVKGKGEWNAFHILAKGTHLVHTINGQVMSETWDESEKDAVAEGILAFQLHAGPPMKIQFRNVQIKNL